MSSSFSIVAIGDISFEGANADKPSGEIFAAVAPIFKQADLTIANLESPLIFKGVSVPGKCTLRGSPGWARVMREAGIRVLSLANNHIMDYRILGLSSTINALDKAGLIYVGAGNGKEQACAPVYLNIRGKTIAILGRTSVIVSSPSYVEKNKSGVAFLDVEETKRSIKSCKSEADLVILLIHWGLEEYFYPSPYQRYLARKFIEAGADLILGHHPHVLQGVEHIGEGMVCHSLGNFAFDDFRWNFVNTDGQLLNRIDRLSQDNRKAGIIRVTFSEKDIRSYEYLPTFIKAGGRVMLDNTLQRKRQFTRLSSRLQWPGYSLFWRAYAIRQEWLLRFKPLFKGKFSWGWLKKLRYKHFRQLVDTIGRSAKITAEKSTNPYE